MHRPLLSLALLALACGESDDKVGGGGTGGDASECEGTGSFEGCADVDGAPQDCPGQDFATTTPAAVAWNGNGGFHEGDGFTLVLGPGDRDLVLAVSVPAGISGPGDIDLATADATAWDVSDPSAPASTPVICGGQLRIDSYTPGAAGSVSGLAFFYLGTDAADCADWPPAVQIGAEFAVDAVDPACAEPEALDAPDPGGTGGDAGGGTGGGTGGGDEGGGTGGDDCPGTTVEGCMSPAHDCPDTTGSFDPATLGGDWWDGDATATATGVQVRSADGRSMQADVGAALVPGTTHDMDAVSVRVTGPDGVTRDRVCGGMLVVDAATTSAAVTGAWFWYIDTADGDCAVWGDVLQTVGRFTAAPVCE